MIKIPDAILGEIDALWHPLDLQEAQSHPIHMPNIPAGSLSYKFIAGLSSSEADIMHGYFGRLAHSNRSVVSRVLERAGEYLPIIQETIKTRNLPLELACLPLMESAFNPRAVSSAGAAGLWQLMPETARQYGLIVNDEIDERFNVAKSTKAAADYLGRLYGLFHDWPLALATYNCGEGAMMRALNRTKATSLPELIQACRELGRNESPLGEETLRFVPQFVAAVQIMVHSHKFGFTSNALLHLDDNHYQAKLDHIREEEYPLVLVGRTSPFPKTELVPQSKRID